MDAPIKGSCTPTLSEPVHVIKSWPHMHKRGRSMNIEVHRAGGAVDSILNNQKFDFNLQKQYDTPYIVNPGDSVWSTCHFENRIRAA